MRTAGALVAALVLPVTLLGTAPTTTAETLPIGHVDCPNGLPDEACFAVAGAAQRHTYTNVALPQNITVQYVQDLLQEAIKVEHGTIPLYLTNLYSINNQSSFAAMTMRSVVMEEMLHMVHAANVLNAIGGHPFLDRPDFIPEYPLVLPLINVSASITWFTFASVKHYQILESIPPNGYNASISAAYLHIVNTLTALCDQHGEEAIFVGDPTLQVETTNPSGQSAHKVTSLLNATTALLGVSDQGGGCPVPGMPWPQYSNISAGPLGGDYSHAARYTEILAGQQYMPTDLPGKPTGPKVDVNWTDVRKFTPNPSVDDFKPEQCVTGGSWVLRDHTFFVSKLLAEYGKLANYTTDTWEDCAKLCIAWTIDDNQPLAPCAMWSWQNDSSTATAQIPFHTCLLAQQFVPPSAEKVEGLVSGCLYGTVCNNSLPSYPDGRGRDFAHGRMVHVSPSAAPPDCGPALQQGMDFASNYTALLVSLHNVFNGQPDTLMNTLMQMYQLKTMAQSLMATPDPRLPNSTLGIGPPWQYIPSASRYAEREGKAFPVA